MSTSTPESTKVNVPDEKDPLLALRGSGKDLWADEHADQYVHRLRGGWELCLQLGPIESSGSRVETSGETNDADEGRT